jgi:hypothetical protein
MEKEFAMALNDLGRVGDAAMSIGHQSNSRFAGTSGLRYLARFTAAMLAAMVLLVCEASYAAQKTIEWFDDLQCSYSIKFDPRKHDEQRLRNTVDVIFTGRAFPEVSPDIPIHPKSPPSQQIELLGQRCEAAIRRATDLPLVDLPGIEAYRKLKLEVLDDECRFSEIEIRAAYVDASALRSYTPSLAECAPFIDALEGKADIMTVWRDLVNSHCPNKADPGGCLSAREGAADQMDRIRYDVLTFGWVKCSTPYKKTADDKRSEKIRMALVREFALRFKIRRPPCSD